MRGCSDAEREKNWTKNFVRISCAGGWEIPNKMINTYYSKMAPELKVGQLTTQYFEGAAWMQSCKPQPLSGSFIHSIAHYLYLLFDVKTAIHL